MLLISTKKSVSTEGCKTMAESIENPEKRLELKILKVNMMLRWKPLILDHTVARLAQLDKRRYAKQEVEGSNPG